jgi:His Kinase A (phospho-acceptor) domain
MACAVRDWNGPVYLTAIWPYEKPRFGLLRSEYELLIEAGAQLARSLGHLQTAQDRLVQTEKLASLGQLTAGIAHEIKNPLNFVNNFSAVSVELIDELREALGGAHLDSKLRAEISEIADSLLDRPKIPSEHAIRCNGASLSRVKFKYIVIAFENPGSNGARWCSQTHRTTARLASYGHPPTAPKGHDRVHAEAPLDSCRAELRQLSEVDGNAVVLRLGDIILGFGIRAALFKLDKSEPWCGRSWRTGSLLNVPSSSRPSLDGEAGGRSPGFISLNFFAGPGRREVAGLTVGQCPGIYAPPRRSKRSGHKCRRTEIEKSAYGEEKASDESKVDQSFA